jgi:acetoin utilization protein AcuA
MSHSAVPGARSRTVDIATAKGVIHIRTHCTPDFVDSLELDEGLGVFPHYRSIVRDKKSMKKIAGLQGANLVLAYNDDGKIVGYVAFADPSPLERWGESGDKLLYELGSIEVSRSWRRFGIAKKMVEIAMDDEELEDRIVFLTGFCWHWDLDGTALS